MPPEDYNFMKNWERFSDEQENDMMHDDDGLVDWERELLEANDEANWRHSITESTGHTVEILTNIAARLGATRHWDKHHKAMLKDIAVMMSTFRLPRAIETSRQVESDIAYWREITDERGIRDDSDGELPTPTKPTAYRNKHGNLYLITGGMYVDDYGNTYLTETNPNAKSAMLALAPWEKIS